MASLCAAAVLTAIGIGSAGGPASEVKPKFQQVDVSKNVSQLIRGNVRHWWKQARVDRDDPKKLPKELRDWFDEYSKFSGVIVGDGHLGNFAVVPVRFANSGRLTMRFVDIDLDDAGVGSFALDFARLVTATKAVQKSVKSGDLLDAYAAGLRGQTAARPKIVNKAMKTLMDDYKDLEAAYIDRHTHGDRFKMKKGELEPYHGKIPHEAIAAALPNANLLDLGIRPKERGGSAGAVRIWVLVKTRGEKHIIELKAHEPTALGEFLQQKPVDEWADEVYASIWKDIDRSNYDLKDIGGQRFWVRPKYIPLFELPLGKDRQKDLDRVNDFALHVAHEMGRIHGAQGGEANGLLRAIERDPRKFKEGVKAYAKRYLELAERELDKK